MCVCGIYIWYIYMIYIYIYVIYLWSIYDIYDIYIYMIYMVYIYMIYIYIYDMIYMIYMIYIYIYILYTHKITIIRIPKMGWMTINHKNPMFWPIHQGGFEHMCDLHWSNDHFPYWIGHNQGVYTPFSDTLDTTKNQMENACFFFRRLAKKLAARWPKLWPLVAWSQLDRIFNERTPKNGVPKNVSTPRNMDENGQMFPKKWFVAISRNLDVFPSKNHLWKGWLLLQVSSWTLVLSGMPSMSWPQHWLIVDIHRKHHWWLKNQVLMIIPSGKLT